MQQSKFDWDFSYDKVVKKRQEVRTCPVCLVMFKNKKLMKKHRNYTHSY